MTDSRQKDESSSDDEFNGGEGDICVPLEITTSLQSFLGIIFCIFSYFFRIKSRVRMWIYKTKNFSGNFKIRPKKNRKKKVKKVGKYTQTQKAKRIISKIIGINY